MRSFPTFHSNTTSLPAEITARILTYVIADAQSRPFGGGVTRRRGHHPVASVSSVLRSVYLNQPYSPSAKDKAASHIKIKIGGALEFSDLKTLAAFFQHGVSRLAAASYRVRFLSISYIDDDTVTGWWQQHSSVYAYEAFESLYSNWHRMEVCWLQLRLPSYRAISSVDDPGIWNILKIRGLAHLAITGPRGCIEPQVRKYLKARTHKKKFVPWRPLSVENPGSRNWIDIVNYRGQAPWREQYEWLDARYKYLHDRETVTMRRIKQRAMERDSRASR